MIVKFPSDRSIPTLLFVLLIALIGKGLHTPLITGHVPRFLQCQRESDCLLDRQKMRLSRAEIADLMQIPKVSRNVAEAIVKKRSAQKAIRSFADLDSIRGIGPKTIERLKTYILIQ